MPLCVEFHGEKYSYSIPNATYMLALEVSSAVPPCSLSSAMEYAAGLKWEGRDFYHVAYAREYGRWRARSQQKVTPDGKINMMFKKMTKLKGSTSWRKLVLSYEEHTRVFV
jgi:hypothetical protein